MKKNAESILNENGLKNTGCRKFILSELIKSENALSENEIKTAFPDLFDRVTFYRTLKTLESSGVIHKIVLSDNTVKYAISHNEEREDSIHTHFHCTKCGEVSCLHDSVKVSVKLPEGFSSSEIDVMINGLCAKCFN
ncbi:MAG: Fur family transcriptional regulator [Paludibacteraceae bacterium]